MSNMVKQTIILELKNVDVKSIQKMIEDDLKSDKFDTQSNDEINTQSDITTNIQSNSKFSFLGQSKQIHDCNISIIDLGSKKPIDVLRYHCYWCKCPFHTCPIGCPINFKPAKITKTYTSITNNNQYAISEDDMSQIKYIFETDGVFCSFNCCLSFINDNKSDSMYKSSHKLLLYMYNMIFPEHKIDNIKCAPGWRLLEQFGGFLNITQFRENFNTCEYKYHGTISDISKPIGHLYEKKIHF